MTFPTTTKRMAVSRGFYSALSGPTVPLGDLSSVDYGRWFSHVNEFGEASQGN